MTPSPARNFKDPRWVKLRKYIFARDGHKCMWCKKKAERGTRSRSLNAHHIKTWTAAPTLRFDKNNLITLCYDCHQKVWGKEKEYEAFFMGLLSQKKDDINNLLWLLQKKYEDIE